MSRWTYMLGVGMTLAALAFIVTEAALGPCPGVTEANARRIREGMTLEQVEMTFGVPAFDPSGYFISTGNDAEQSYLRWWKGNGNWVSVWFNRGNRVETVEVRVSAVRSITPFERLRSWFGW